MLLYGASGHAKVIADIICSAGCSIKGIFDDDPTKREFLGMSIITGYRADIFEEEEIVLSIGNNYVRMKKSQIVMHKYGLAVHPSAVLAKSCLIGAGTAVMHKCIVQSESQIGSHVILNTGASIDHECIIEDYVHISPMSVLCGNVNVGEGTHIGAGAVIIQGVKIGKWATIGAGSVIIRDVPDNAVVVGNPGRIIRFNGLQS